MVRIGLRIGVVAAAGIAIAATPASAQVRDAVYRGTMVCDKLPFSAGKIREAIEVTIGAGAVPYTHVVRLAHAAEATPEKGTGTLSGQNVTLQGSWQGGNRKYEADYSRSFVRRHAFIKVKQAWSNGGKTISGASVPSSGR
jgi:hypothetical protein